MQWNPNAPDLLGLEFAPRPLGALPSYRVDAPAKGILMRVKSTASETVNDVAMLISSDATDGHGEVLAEIIKGGQELTGAVTTTIVRPTAQPTSTTFPSANRNTAISGGASVLALLQRSAVNSATDDYVHFDASAHVHSIGDQWLLTLAFGAAGTFTGERIIAVRCVLVASDPAGFGDGYQVNEAPTGAIAYYFAPWNAGFSLQPVNGTSNATNLPADSGEIRPAIRAPWTPADLDALAPGGAGMVVIEVNGSSCTPGFTECGISYSHLYQVYLEVDHVPENRVAVNLVTTGTTDPTVRQWIDYVPWKPSDRTAGFSKVATQDLTLCLRQARHGGVPDNPGGTPRAPADYRFSAMYIDGITNTLPLGLAQYSGAALNLNGTISTLGAPSPNRIIGFNMGVSGTQSVDSQPYARVDSSAATTAAGASAPQQKLTSTVTDVYAGVIAVVQPTTIGANLTASSLIVELHRVSDSALMATATITPADIAALTPDAAAGWYRIVKPFTALTSLSAGVQYYLSFYTDVDKQWLVARMRTDPATGPSVDGLATFGGTTDLATISASNEPLSDLSAVVYRLPAPPTNATAASQLLTAGVLGPCAVGADCGLDGVPFNRIAWTWPAATLGSYIEIQRQDAYADWYTVARIYNTGITTWDDYESSINIETCYRLRIVTPAMVNSNWAMTNCVTLPSAGVGYTFTTNQFPTASIGYIDEYISTGRPYKFPEAGETKLQKILGRDMFVAFKPIEQRGDHLDITLLANGLVVPGRPGPRTFDALRNLIRSPIQYICVRDDWGNRWFASVTVPDGRAAGDGTAHWMTITVDEVTSIPSSAEIT